MTYIQYYLGFPHSVIMSLLPSLSSVPTFKYL